MALNRRVTSRGIICKDGKIFAQKLKNDTGAREYWCTPGGKLDPVEGVVDGVSRELIEETGVKPKVGRLLFVQQFVDGDWEYVEFFFHIENPEDYTDIDLESTSHGVLEVAEFDFVDPKEIFILPAFLSTIDVQAHIDSGAPVYIHNEMK